ncbi:hypothetical protein [Cetobacterium somerae]|uniref:hypothetical protein n=1 Tax=Cetobacterium somerae TaxID=188913 RepID=UPI00389169DC
MDRHLNIFTPFSENAKENNLTRALILILQREPLFFSMFLEKIIGNGLNESLLKEDIEFNTQKLCKELNLEGIEKIYAVTLNTDKYEDNIEESRETENPITDISIQLGNVLIIIEVKRHGEDPRKQLNNQIEKINTNSITPEFKSLSWQELLNISIPLEQFTKKLKHSNIFLTEFNCFIEESYPELLPTSKITAHLSFERIERRIKQIEKEINYLIHGENFDENPNFIKLKNCNFAERFKISFNQEDKKIYLTIWPGDNNKQANFLYKEKFNLKNLKENLKNNLNTNNLIFGKNYDVLIYQYIKFAHIMGKGVYWEHIKDEKNILDIYKEIKGITKKSDTEKWEKLKLKISEYVGDKEIFLKNFSEHFEESNRSYVNVNVGTCISLSFDINHIEKIESENNTKQFFDKIIKLIIDTIEKL